MIKVEVVVESLGGWRTDVELGIGPEAQDGGGEHVGAGVPQALEVAHLVALIERLAFHVVFGCFHYFVRCASAMDSLRSARRLGTCRVKGND